MAVDLAPGLSRKLKKVLDCRTDSPEVAASLATLDTFYTTNTPHDRRHLRSTIEKRSLSINQEFLLAASPALEALDRVEEDVNGLAECCDKIANALRNCNIITGDIISTTERLEQELGSTTQRQEIVSCFLRDYQLSNEEIIALREENLNENFFKALSRVQEIHTNCKILLRTHHQRAGLELMDMMSVYQEGAYERLCRWVQAECRKLGDSDNTEVSDLLKKAVCCLKERPVLFKYCAEEVANMRHNALFRRFISALTRGGPGGLPRPIEVHAHDPLRYVGDMLGWLHQALASERELVLVLFDPDAAVDTGPTARRFSKDGANNSTRLKADLTFVLDRIFEGVCRPFKVRVEQVLQSQPSLILSYKLSNTLEFYSYTIQDLLGNDTALSNTLLILKDAAQQTFFDILKTRGDKILKYPSLITADLSPPPFVSEGVLVLLEIIDTYNSMMVAASGKKLDFEPVISALLDPIVQMCQKAADAQKSKGTTLSSRRNKLGSDSRHLNQTASSSVDAILNNSLAFSLQHAETPSKIFLINCLSAIQQPLLGHEVAEKYVSRLASMIETQLNILVDNEVDAVLRACSLSDKMSYIQRSVNEEQTGDSLLPLATIEEMSPSVVSDSLRIFFSIITGSVGSLREFEQMQVPQLRSQASLCVAKALAEVYERIYGAIVDPRNQYPEPKSLLRHPPGQVRTILGI